MARRQPGKGVQAISTSGISGSLLSEIASSPSAAEQFVTNLNQLAKDLQSGNLSAAQQDYVTLSEDALNSAASSPAPAPASGLTTSLLSGVASSSTGASSLVNELNHIGADLDNGDLRLAQGDMRSIDSTVLNATSSAIFNATSSTSSAESAMPVETTQLIVATIRAMEAGDGSAAGTDISQLASLLSNIERVSYRELEGGSYGDFFSSSSIGQLSHSVDADSSSISQYDMSLLAWHLLGYLLPEAEHFRERDTRKKLRRVSSRRFAEAKWPIALFLAGFQEPEDLKEALDYIVSEKPLRGFAHRVMEEADSASTPMWQRMLIGDMANRIKNDNAAG